MPLKGNLRDFSTAQLLNLINLARKTGRLAVEGPNDTIWVYFREGKLAYAHSRGGNNGLPTILHKAKLINASQERIITEKAGDMSDKELGLLLINADYLSQQQILSSLVNHYTDLINRLFTLIEGFFEFKNDTPPPEDKIAVRISLENLIINGTRKLREWEQLQDEIPSLDMALKFAEHPGANIQKVNLSVEEWRVVSYINPKNSIRQIAKATSLSDLEIRKIVYRLIQAGMVEIIRPQGITTPFPRGKEPLPEETKTEQKSLVNRIISRIRSL
jgi:hypothetical protein